ncbi:hypothetical protein L596_008875 [Steinernema carpocapsae]|uniref:Uncharacterized protein n=1 Tax=Steinernema carpocapsae TaxID=34508 RepID=A0A4U5PDT6_STECR|nr:hypothetical protein L596_008872 [Steinernema carpocapsae]TKR94612.1 hypothetical protein L596_008875 [Steinernema carpocapsae]
MLYNFTVLFTLWPGSREPMLVPKRCFIVAASVSLLIYTVLGYPTVQLILSQTPNHENLRFALLFLLLPRSSTLLLLFGSLPKRGIPAPGTQEALRHMASAELLFDASRTETLQTMLVLRCEFGRNKRWWCELASFLWLAVHFGYK